MDASILVEESDDLSPLAFNVSLQLSAANREVAEEVFDRNSGALLARDDAGALQLPGNLELEPRRTRGFLFGACDDCQFGEGAEGGQCLSSEAKRLQC